MDNVITFTPAGLVALILGVCAGIITIAGAIGVIAKGIDKARAPERKQNLRLDEHEKRLDAHDEIIEKFRVYFINDDKRFKEIETSNKVTQSALLALLKFNINGDDKKSLQDAEKDLEKYLLNK